jgi:cysteinyl-tRNA synthetase
MDEDFDTPNLLTYQNDLLKELNLSIRNNTDFSQCYAKLLLINQILGLKYGNHEITDDDVKLYQEWMKKREQKDFESADKLRNKLIELDVL